MTEKEECGSCGSTPAERQAYASKNDEATSTDVTQCTFCDSDKCCVCDMGADVACVVCDDLGDSE